MYFICHIIILLNIYILLVLSANLPIGKASLLTMCQAAFYGIGAYIGTFFLRQFNLPFVVIAAMVMLFTGAFSFLISYASVRLKNNYFVIATIGFQLIVFIIMNNWMSVTHGPRGVIAIPSIKLFGLFEVSQIYGHLFLSLVTMIVVVLIFKHLVNSPYGRVLSAIRADELTTQALGRNTVKFKSWAFFLSAAVAGMAGIIYASYLHYIEPTNFTLDKSISIITALFIGGVGNTKGSIIGAAFVVLLPELLVSDEVGLPLSVANLLQIIYGLLLVLVAFFRPQGICGKAILK